MVVPVLPSLRGLAALATLAKAGSLSAGAARLGVTRSALSHRLAELETHLGVALVQKAGRRIILTEDGHALLAAMGDAIERIEAAVEPLRRRKREIRLSTVATFASHWLIPRLPDLQARHPDIELTITTTTRPLDLANEDVDCAIRHGLGTWEGVVATLLFHETLIPVAAPAIADRIGMLSKKTPWRSVRPIYARTRFIDWSVWQNHAGDVGIAAPAGGIIVETRAQALDAALAGAGVAIFDAAYISRYVADGRLRALAVAPVELAEAYYFIHRPNVRNPQAIFALRDWLVGAVG